MSLRKISNKKIIKFKTITFNELSVLNITDQANYYSARIRRSIKRGFSLYLQRNIINLNTKKLLRLRSKNIIIIPQMVGKIFHVYDGKVYQKIQIKDYMCGTYLGQYVLTRKIVKHSKAGKGATKGSKFTPLK